MGDGAGSSIFITVPPVALTYIKVGSLFHPTLLSPSCDDTLRHELAFLDLNILCRYLSLSSFSLV